MCRTHQRQTAPTGGTQAVAWVVFGPGPENLNPSPGNALRAATGPQTDDWRLYNLRMNSADGTSSGLRPPLRWRLALAAISVADVSVADVAAADVTAAEVAAPAVAPGWIVAALAAAAASSAAAEPSALSASAGPMSALVPALWGLLLAGAAGLGLTLGRQRQRATAELREVRERLRCIDELLDVWQWQTDAQHRLVLLSPPRSAPAADWLAARPGTLLWKHFQAADEAALQARLASQARLDDLDVQDLAAPGGPRRFCLRGRPRSDAAGQFAGYQGLLREVLPLATAMIAVPADSGTAAPDTGALEAEHESFSFTVSHDLRAPIRVVEGFTKIVKEDYGRLLDRVGNDHLDRVLGAAARMNNMIDALLALSKLSSQPLARQPVNLSQLAAYVADDLRRQWPEREVQIDIEPGLLVLGDPTLLRVVIENLLGNAWKYSAKAAQPQIALRRRARDADTFTVCDNGAGFDMRFADRLFGVFQRLHSAHDFPGTGVGLASVRRIVRRHGGEIWGEAEVNRGASFHFSLPQVRQA